VDEECIWTTATGCHIPIADLQTRHLKNIIRLLRRTAGGHKLALALEADSHCFNEHTMAAWDVDRIAESLYRMEDEEYLEEFVPQWGNLLAEAEKRGLSTEERVGQ